MLVAVSLTSLNAQTADSAAIKQVDSLIKVSRELTAQRDYTRALEINAAAEKLCLEKFGNESAAYASVAFNRGRVNYLKGDYQESEKWNLESLAIREKVLGKNHVDYAWSLNNLANLYKDMRKYEKAEPLLLESKDIREQLLGKGHLDYAGSCNNLAILYAQMGKYLSAEPFYIEAIAIKERLLGSDNLNYASNLSNLASLYFKMLNYDKAEKTYLTTRNIQEKLLGKEHPEYANTLNYLGKVYYEIGNYEKAESLHKEAKSIQEKTIGKDHPDYANTLNYLANIYYQMGNYEKTEPLYMECKAIREKLLGKEHEHYAFSLNNLAVLYFEMGNTEKAEPLFIEALALKEKLLGRNHPDYAWALGNLAVLYLNMGNYKKAEALNIEAMHIKEKILGTEHPDYIISLKNLGKLYEIQKRFSDSEPLLNKASNSEQTKLVQAAGFLSEKELGKYAKTFQKSGDNLSGYLLARQSFKAQTGILPSLAYDNALFYKGFLLTAVSQMNSFSMASKESRAIKERLKGYHQQLAEEYSKPIADRKSLAGLEEEANMAEKELARSVSAYGDNIRQVKWYDVQSSLKSAEAVIEFVSFKKDFPKPTDSVVYAALLLKSGDKSPRSIPLFEEKSLDSLLNSKSDRKADYVNTLYTLADRGAVAVEAPKKSLYDIIWKPLEKELPEVKTIYFSPSGLLHRINLDAIPVSETETLADKYNLNELNSTRNMVIPNQVKIANNEAVLFGGIQYEKDTIIQNNEAIYASRSRAELSFSYVDSTLRGGGWNYLPGTEREVNAIEKIMQTSGVQTELKKGYGATEESFKNIGANNNPSPRILHIASHGYFFPDPKEQSKSNGLSGQNEPVFKISDHPMLRSGLIMAGGNATWQGKQTLEGKEDGILTAYEISQMNLSNTELVVLSACETGLGDIQGNEGVYGLQRAFKIAGAKYLIMSLWQVPDKQTSLLMTTFYKKWLEEKRSIPDAFRAAQKELRDIGLDPYQWAGFVLVE